MDFKLEYLGHPIYKEGKEDIVINFQSGIGEFGNWENFFPFLYFPPLLFFEISQCREMDGMLILLLVQVFLLTDPRIPFLAE